MVLVRDRHCRRAILYHSHIPGTGYAVPGTRYRIIHGAWRWAGIMICGEQPWNTLRKINACIQQQQQHSGHIQYATIQTCCWYTWYIEGGKLAYTYVPHACTRSWNILRCCCVTPDMIYTPVLYSTPGYLLSSGMWKARKEERGAKTSPRKGKQKRTTRTEEHRGKEA